MQFTFKTNLNCGNCVKSVTPKLNELDIIEQWKVDLDHDNRLLHVQLDEEELSGIDDPKAMVIAAVQAAGFEAYED